MISFASCCCVGFLALLAAPLYFTFLPPQVYEVKGACAVVTGASDGIGVFIAHKLAEEGVSKLVIGARRLDMLEEVAQNISKHYPSTKVLPVKLDVASDECRERFVESVGPCEILVNNAGVDRVKAFEKLTDKDIDSMMTVNLVGTIKLVRALLPGMLQAGRGHVVNIASLAGKTVAPYITIYSSTKWGLLGFTGALRAEMQFMDKPITAHGVSPGFVRDTGMARNNAVRHNADLDKATQIYGYSYPVDTANAVVQAIKYNEPDVIVNSPPVRPLMAIKHVFPRFADFKIKLLTMPGLDGAFKFFELIATKNVEL